MALKENYMTATVIRTNANQTSLSDKSFGRELIRFNTAGSVDNGKSTLIGRLLFDSGGLPEDVIAAIAARSRDNAKLNLAAFTDGLKAERERGSRSTHPIATFNVANAISSWRTLRGTLSIPVICSPRPLTPTRHLSWSTRSTESSSRIDATRISLQWPG